MNWTPLTSNQQIDDIKENNGYSLIFKHSTRCNISVMAKKKFELDCNELPTNILFYYLDLLSYRLISNSIANSFAIKHQSPQLLVIKNGECVLHQSHGDISVDDVNLFISKTGI